MEKKDKKHNVIVRLTKETHTKIKNYCLKNGLKIKWYVEKLIIDDLSK